MNNNELDNIQSQIDCLQQDLHSKIESSDFVFKERKNEVFKARRKAIAELIASKDIPSNFWGATVVSLLKLKAKTDEIFPHVMGPYDEMLLSNYLTDMNVSYTKPGHRISFIFASNPYFKETELWAEVHDVMDLSEEGGGHTTNDEVGEWEKVLFSGITWNEGYGPAEEKDQDDADDDGAIAGNKHTREEDATHSGRGYAKDNANGDSKRGYSILEVFSAMPPPPDEADETSDEDMDILEAIEVWRDEMEDRRMLLDTLSEEAFVNPIGIWKAAENLDDIEVALKKARKE